MPDHVWRNLFKFTFVRNPYERVISAWASFGEVLNDNGKSIVPFPQFIETLSANNFEDLCQEVTETEQFQLEWQVLPMANHLCNAQGELELDYIGKQENLNEDWLYVAGLFGLPKTPMSNVRHNASEHELYKNYYTVNLQNKVYNYYKKDFELFDYNPEIDFM